MRKNSNFLHICFCVFLVGQIFASNGIHAVESHNDDSIGGVVQKVLPTSPADIRENVEGSMNAFFISYESVFNAYCEFLKRRDSLCSEVEGLSNNIRLLEDEITELNQKKGSLEDECDRMQQRIGTMRAEVITLEEKLSALTGELHAREEEKKDKELEMLMGRTSDLSNPDCSSTSCISTGSCDMPLHVCASLMQSAAESNTQVMNATLKSTVSSLCKYCTDNNIDLLGLIKEYMNVQSCGEIEKTKKLLDMRRLQSPVKSKAVATPVKGISTVPTTPVKRSCVTSGTSSMPHFMRDTKASAQKRNCIAKDGTPNKKRNVASPIFNTPKKNGYSYRFTPKKDGVMSSQGAAISPAASYVLQRDHNEIVTAPHQLDDQDRKQRQYVSTGTQLTDGNRVISEFSIRTQSMLPWEF